MLKDIIKNRYSARTWLPTSIEQEKINYILNCAVHAPSKQSLYPWKIYVLGENSNSKSFKEWLFWENTWCVNGERANPSDKESQNKRFNGQYRAPLLLLWTHRALSEETHKNENYWKSYLPYQQEQDLIDMTVSASFAMLAAEELGLRTCFGRCHEYEFTNTILDEGTVKMGIALGIGYAEDDNNHNNRMLDPVIRNDRLEGYETKNLSQSFPIKYHNIRQKKPNISNLIKIIN
jgi:nitroreductase